MPSTSPTRGRPRGRGTDDAILAAAREILTENGYDALSFEEVAARAGVTRPTIYRRWPNKLHLAYAAAFSGTDGYLFTTSENFGADVKSFVQETVDSYSRPATRAAAPGILAAFQQQPDIAKLLREPHETLVRRRFNQAVTAAQQRGESRPSVDPDMLFDTIIGAVQFRLVFHQKLDGRFVDQLTRLVLNGAGQTPLGPP